MMDWMNWLKRGWLNRRVVRAKFLLFPRGDMIILSNRSSDMAGTKKCPCCFIGNLMKEKVGTFAYVGDCFDVYILDSVPIGFSFVYFHCLYKHLMSVLSKFKHFNTRQFSTRLLTVLIECVNLSLQRWFYQ